MAFNPANDPDIIRFAGDFLVKYWKHPVPDFHRELYGVAVSDKNRIVRAAPRSFAKSTVFSLTFPLYEICQGDNHKGIIISETADLAIDWLRIIKTELEENKAILSVYGDMKTDKWRENLIICKRADGSKFELRAKGRGAQIRGFRPDWVVCDDLENDEEVRSEEQRAKTLDWFNKALINTLDDEGSRCIMIGTVLHPLSLLSNVLDREAWDSKVYKALTPTGESIWPEKWPVEALERRRKDIGDIAFRSEFMNEPIISENPVFLKEWFKHYEQDSEAFEKEKRQGLYIVSSCDPAISKRDDADYSAVVTVGATFDKEPRIFVLDVRRGHWSLRDTVTNLFLVHEKWKQRRTRIETVAYQQALADEARAEETNRRCNIGLFEYKPDKDKERRAHAISSIAQDGRVYFDGTDRMQQKLMEELMLFPTGDHDDLVDAFTDCLHDVKEWGGRHDDGIKEPIIVRRG